jgi:hypothetical protein
MFRNKTIWFLFFILLISVFIFNYSNKVKVEYSSNTTVKQKPSSENNKQLIEPITISSQQPKTALVEETSNEGNIVECSLESFVEAEEDIEAQLQHFQSLSSSTSQDRQLEYILFAQLPDKSKLELLLEYNDKFPNNSLALMETVSLCTLISNSKCNKSLIDAAIASDKDNGAMWFHSALFFASKSDDDGVLTSISELIKTPFFNEKYGERIKLYAQALEGTGAYDFHTNIVGGIGVEAARPSPFNHIFKWCKESETITKINACLQLGINLEKRSKTGMSQLLGMHMQKLIFKAEGNIELAHSLEEASETLMKPLYSKEFKKASSLMFHNEKLLRHWLDNLDLIGEVESAEVLIDEAIYISQEKGTHLCKTSKSQ